MIVCDDDEDESEEVLHLDEAKISLNLVVRLTLNHSMKIKGLTGGGMW